MTEREQELFDRALIIIMDEYGHDRQWVMDWLSDDTQDWNALDTEAI